VVVVTSDKCYENLEQGEPFREEDRLGGRDPYSASKGCTEIAVASMRQSYFKPHAPAGHPARVASARGGNVIGGGDWAEGRLVPDIVRGCLGGSGSVTLRAPGSVRPWQFVLELLRGYLDLAERLIEDAPGAASAWNFGPDRASERSVAEITEEMVLALGRGRIVRAPDAGAPHEAVILRLDAGRAGRELGWRPVLSLKEAVALTAAWYARWADGADPARLTAAQIDDFTMRLTHVAV
jgi:CDP-glucose 4,6-dehydratase